MTHLRARTHRFPAALATLVFIYAATVALGLWQASNRPVPTIFTDELELTQLSRAISATGEAARRGQPYGLATLVAYVLAPSVTGAAPAPSVAPGVRADLPRQLQPIVTPEQAADSVM